jgi:glycopeptide antibiotics resistance protein
VLRSRRRVPLWVWWMPVVWAASVPLGFTTEPQWDRVNLVPFGDSADKLSDLAINMLMFVPFGYSFARWPGGIARLLLAAAAVSVTAEMLQLFSTVRYPSGTDVANALAGALAGYGLARVRSRFRHAPERA